MYMLGYLPKEGRVYLMDKTGAIVSYGLLLALLEYQTAVVRRDFAAANRILAEIPREHYNKIARFLDGQGFKAEALAVADDPDLKFDLAVQLGRLDAAYGMLKAAAAAGGEGAEDADAQAKWKTLMDLALAKSNLPLAEECASAARDVSGLLLLYSSTGNAEGMARLAVMAREEGRANVAFLALHTLGRVEEAATLLADTGRIAEVRRLRRAAARVAGKQSVHVPAWLRCCWPACLRCCSHCCRCARWGARTEGLLPRSLVSVQPAVCASTVLIRWAAAAVQTRTAFNPSPPLSPLSFPLPSRPLSPPLRPSSSRAPTAPAWSAP
jgi:hypothetical protein